MAPRSAAAAEPPNLIFVGLHAEYGVDAAVVRLLSEHVVEVVRSAHAFGKVISPSDLESLAGAERASQMLQCDSEGCLAELAGSFGAGFVMRGTVGRLGQSFLVALRLLDVGKATVVATGSARIKSSDEDALLDGIPPLVKKVLDDAKLGGDLTVAPPPPPPPPPPAVSTPAATTTAAAPEKIDSDSGPPWKLLGLGSMACAGVSCCLAAPLASFATYWGVGFTTMIFTGSPPIGDAAGYGSAALVALPPVLVAVVTLGFAIFAFTRGLL